MKTGVFFIFWVRNGEQEIKTQILHTLYIYNHSASNLFLQIRLYRDFDLFLQIRCHSPPPPRDLLCV